MKGVILAGGIGSRLRPFTFTGPKQLVPVANKPIIYYALEDMEKYGIKEVALVISPHNSAEFIKHIGAGKQWNLKIEYILQNEPLGLAHAIYCAKDFVDKRKFLVILGDNFVEDDLSGVVDRFKTQDELNALIILKKVKNPEALGVVKVDANNVLAHFEKPIHPPSNLASIGYYMFDFNTFDIPKEEYKPSSRGEYEISLIINHYAKNPGLNIGYYELKGPWIDTGKMEDLLFANRVALSRLLKQEYSDNFQTYGNNVEIIEPVIMGKDVDLLNCQISGPVIIGNGTRIYDAYIGPFTAIGNNVTISNSSIENSIVMTGATINNLDVPMRGSVIGQLAKINRRKTSYKEFKLGDYSEIYI